MIEHYVFSFYGGLYNNGLYEKLPTALIKLLLKALPIILFDVPTPILTFHVFPEILSKKKALPLDDFIWFLSYNLKRVIN